MRGLFDYEYQLEEINKHQPPLQKLNKVIEWEIFRAPIKEALHVEPKAPGGRPPFDKLMMFKIIILQRYYNLSDEQTEFQIKDRLSFMQFLGLQIGDTIPDQKTIWHFKKHKLSKRLFELFTTQLVNNGVIARKGSIVEASFVNVPRQRNTKEENQIIKEGDIPQNFENNPAKLAQKDTDARWMTKNAERHFGYKNHVNADAATKLITKFTTSSASLHDSQKKAIGKERIESIIGLLNLTYNLFRYEQLVRLQKVKII